LDISAWAGLQSREIIPGCYIRGHIAWLPFKDKVFDLCYCEGVLEHIEEQLIDRVMNEMYRVSHKRILGVSFDAPNTLGHICNHSLEWWVEKIPSGTYLGFTGRSLDRENIWLYKT
jgi:ubiquinone/menaquinone biosynthesis C-methylase UbiE